MLNFDLGLKDFDEYQVEKTDIHAIGDGGRGVQYIFEFENEYGASVIKRPGSYGYDKDLWELAVLYRDALTFTTPITDDVLGYLSTDDVRKALIKIKEMKND